MVLVSIRAGAPSARVARKPSSDGGQQWPWAGWCLGLGGHRAGPPQVLGNPVLGDWVDSFVNFYVRTNGIERLSV